jgi:hypothetical protein
VIFPSLNPTKIWTPVPPVCQIAKQIGEAQALAALDNLAKELGGKGVEMWEELAGSAG